MKRLLYVIAALLFVLQYSSVQAQTEQPEMRLSVCVGEERLENLLTDNQKDSVTHLTITGTMAEEDYAFIRRNRLKRITELNFRDADIDTIPPHAFDFEWVSSSCEYDREIILPLLLKYIDDYGLCIKVECKILLTGAFPSLGENALRSGSYADEGEYGELLPSSDNEYLKEDSGYLLSVNDSVLYYCNSYFSPEVPDGVHVISGNAFEHASVIELILPENVDSIGNRAFANIHWYTVCRSVPSYDETYIRLKSLVPPKLGTDVFFDPFGFSASVYVPEESFELYKNTEVWKDLNLMPYKETFNEIGHLQMGNGSLSVSNENGEFVLKSSKKICNIKCYNLEGYIRHNMPVYDYKVHLNKNIINVLSIVRVKYEDGTSETVKLEP